MHACVCFFCQHSVGIKSMWKITMQICDIDMVSFYYCIASQCMIDRSKILIVSCSLFYRTTGLFWQSPSATMQMSSPCPSKHRLVVKASALRAEDPGFESRLRRDFFRGGVIPVTSKLALQWLPCQALGVVGSVQGLIGPVSVYCEWVRWKVWYAASISVWQHVKLSEQICP